MRSRRAQATSSRRAGGVGAPGQTARLAIRHALTPGRTSASGLGVCAAWRQRGEAAADNEASNRVLGRPDGFVGYGARR